MPPARLRLKPGVSAADAIAVLHEQIATANRIVSGAIADYAVREAYILWVEAAEARLVSLTDDRALTIRPTASPITRPRRPRHDSRCLSDPLAEISARR